MIIAVSAMATADEYAAHADTYRAWAEAIDTAPYPPFMRDVWLLHGTLASHSQIAQRLGCSISKVRRAIDRIVRDHPQGRPRNIHDKGCGSWRQAGARRHEQEQPGPEPESVDELASAADPAVVSDVLAVATDVLRERGLLEEVAERCARNPALAELLPETIDNKGPITMTYRQIFFARQVRFVGKLGAQQPGMTERLINVEAEPSRDGLTFELMVGADRVKQLVPWTQVLSAVAVAAK